MKKQFYVCAFAALLLYFIGCAPLPTFVLDPADGNSTWLHGKQIVSKSDGSFAVAVSFEETEGTNLVFDVNIKNLSDTTALIEPEKFYYRGLALKKDSLYESRYPSYALDPEFQLLQLDRQIAHENANRETSEGLDLFVGLLGVAADIATINEPKTEEQIRNEEEAEFEREMTSKAEAAEYRQTIRDLNDYRSYWKRVTLRKTSLGPNQSVSGKVYFAAKPFPPMKRMKMIKIYFPVGDKQYDFLFNRTKYKW